MVKIHLEKVSIIIPFYNCQFVNIAIESALSQTYTNVEVIVIDDGSTKYIEKIKPYLKSIKFIQKRNGGTASALNTGIKNATGDYFAWLSSDDIFMPEKTSKQLSYMKENDASVCYSPYTIINAQGKHLKTIQSHTSNQILFTHRFFNYCPVNGCTVMTKMDVFTNVGLFDESLLYANDYDMWCRIVLKYKFFYINQPLTLYREHEKMGTKMKQEEIKRETEIVKERYKELLNNYIHVDLRRKK